MTNALLCLISRFTDRRLSKAAEGFIIKSLDIAQTRQQCGGLHNRVARWRSNTSLIKPPQVRQPTVHFSLRSRTKCQIRNNLPNPEALKRYCARWRRWRAIQDRIVTPNRAGAV